MLLVIFGAGASYDSVPHLPPPVPTTGGQNNWTPINSPTVGRHEEFRPPLANQLFEDRPIFVEAMQLFGDCRPLVPLLRKRGTAIEQELAKFQEQAKTFPERYRQLAAIRYYLHFALQECQRHWLALHRGITNYVTLLDAIERWRFEFKEQVCFVTFNYDTMLEDAMSQVLRFSFRDLSSYISREDYRLIKLHGSVTWGREVDGIANAHGLTPQSLIDRGADLQISGRYRITSRFLAPLEEDGTVVFPALSIPVENKDEFSCPREHVEMLGATLRQVSKLIAVGWRATEADFLGMLNARLTGLTGTPDLMVVSGDSEGAEETKRNLSRPPAAQFRDFIFGDFIPIEDGFTGLIERMDRLDAFLRALRN